MPLFMDVSELVRDLATSHGFSFQHPDHLDLKGFADLVTVFTLRR